MPGQFGGSSLRIAETCLFAYRRLDSPSGRFLGPHPTLDGTFRVWYKELSMRTLVLSLVLAPLTIASGSSLALAADTSNAPVDAKLAFKVDNGKFVFDTGLVRGSLQQVKEAADGKPGFVESAKDKGQMQLYPASEDVLAIVKDGRWKFPPYPNDWAIRPVLAAPLGMRQHPRSGVTVVIMAPPEDCFAVSMSQQEAGLGAFYLSLFGKDVKKGETLIGHARMVFGMNLADDQAVQAYRDYLESRKP
jgi:hypothetical protein